MSTTAIIRNMHDPRMNLLNLPSELIVRILEFILSRLKKDSTILLNISSDEQLYHDILFMNLISSVHSHFYPNLRRPVLHDPNSSSSHSTYQELETHFNEIWWRLFERFCGDNFLSEQFHTLKELKNLAMNKGLKRCMCLLYKTKRQMMRQEDEKKVEEYRIILLGAGGVGKSNLIIRYVLNQHVPEYDPFLEESFRKQIQLDNRTTYLDILETSEHDDVHNWYRKLIIEQARVIVLVCSVDNYVSSMKYIKETFDSILKVKKSSDFPCIFVMNKIDLEKDRESTEFVNDVFEMVQQYKLSNFAIFEASALNSTNTNAIFEDCVRRFRNGGHRNIELLHEIIQHDVKVLKNLGQSKKCLLM
ncbi:hypothetical protein C9374_008220 [Naegleria lovaniensis]|uniref:Ras family small GTPase n=1 Tax=Naegleria lovaniensis TaxID=51637 RepID=A0AA88KHV2_NAELO|nr:uncharacterized protein C9374_008220 [Naegleria lovaniensis]KAG2378581.1 hypothetical protein C9374_008220 [Naegleria lovaniensis]